MLLDEDVEWAYRTVLRREPESREIIGRWVEVCPNVRELVERMLISAEYSGLVTAMAVGQSKPTLLYHRTAYGFLQPVDISDPLMIRSYVDRIYEQEETDCIAGLLKRGDHCVDLGARHGWFTSLMASVVGPTGFVWAFEPDTSLDYVQLSVQANKFGNVSLIKKGASDTAGISRFDPITASIGTGPVSIETIRLDDALRYRPAPLRLIKMDIEGAEYKALKGGLEILKADRPYILMELADDLQRRVSGAPATESVGLLRGLGYIPSVPGGESVSDTWIDAQIADGRIFNLLFTPSAHP